MTPRPIVVAILMLAILGAGQAASAASDKESQTVASGQFYGASNHRARGTAALIRTSDGGYAVRLDGFLSDPGPDIYIILSTAEAPRTSRDIKAGRYITLGRRKGETGAQSYDLPITVDPGAYRSVAIWCRQYSILFGAAPLESRE